MMRKIFMMLMLLMIGTGSLYAKRGGVCLPLDEVRTVKKAILTLNLSKDQKSKIVTLEETLKEQMSDVRSGMKKGEAGKLSSLFGDSGFKRQEFMTMTSVQNQKTSELIAVYFEKLYALLDAKQQKALIEKFKRIEKKKLRKK